MEVDNKCSLRLGEIESIGAISSSYMSSSVAINRIISCSAINNLCSTPMNLIISGAAHNNFSIVAA